MKHKSTDELEESLNNTHARNIAHYLAENKESLISEEKPFAAYMRNLIREKKLLQQDIFLQADIPERYGYKLISEEKRTKQRDVILRLCYAAQFSLEETQQALKIYGMPQLYVRIPRDAVLMVCFKEYPGSILAVNTLLAKQNMERLRSSGVQE